MGKYLFSLKTTFLLGVKSKMCIMPGETFSETNLKEHGVFEGGTVNTIVKAMTVYPDATFLGENINVNKNEENDN